MFLQAHYIFFSFVIFFLTGPEEVMRVAFTYSLTISDRKFYRKVYIFFEDRHIIGELSRQTMAFFATLNFLSNL